MRNPQSRRTLAALALLGVVATITTPGAQGVPAGPSIDDIINLKRVGAAAISPDGSRAAYTMRETNWDENAYETEIWIGDAATGQSYQLTNARKSDWMTYYVNTDIHPFTRQYLKANPWDDPKIYADTSPMTYIKQAKTPTLIQHGDQDTRVPIPNAFQLYQGLRDQQVPVQLSIFKGFGHNINKPNATRAAMQQNFEWFNRYIWNQPTTSVQ